jgi:hypothetical protein
MALFTQDISRKSWPCFALASGLAALIVTVARAPATTPPQELTCFAPLGGKPSSKNRVEQIKKPSLTRAQEAVFTTGPLSQFKASLPDWYLEDPRKNAGQP